MRVKDLEKYLERELEFFKELREKQDETPFTKEYINGHIDMIKIILFEIKNP